MRSLLIGVLLSSSSALASPSQLRSDPPLTNVAVEDMPEACRDLAKLASSPSRNRALSARISLASCLAEERLRAVPLCDCEQSALDIETASAQSLALLGEVTTYGDPTMQILAQQTLGDLLSGFATRLLATVPPPANASEAALDLRETRLQMLLPRVAPWQERARMAYSEIDRIARANPQLARNPAVQAAVKSSRAKLRP